MKNNVNTDFLRCNHTIYHHFSLEIRKGSQITLPSHKNATRLKSGRFRAVLQSTINYNDG